jgi:membrane fusion protein (multidrug efflux system)
MPEVVYMEVAEREVLLTTSLVGRTVAHLASEVRPQVSGIIQKRMFVEGTDVKAGTVLYQIDPAPFQVAYDSAAASLARAEANLPSVKSRAERFKELVETKAVSRQDFDDAQSAYLQAMAEIQYWKAMLDSTRINLGYTRVTAPISGRIGRSNVTEGALVTANQPTALAIITELDPIYVDVPQSTADLLRLKRRIEAGSLHASPTDSKKVRLVLEDGTEYPLDGTLQFREVTVEQSTGTVTLRAVFPNPQGVLLPGMFVKAVVQEGMNRHAILIPQNVVSRDQKGNPYVMVLDPGGKVDQRQITIEREIENSWLVTSGLASGDRVITVGFQMVKPGMQVKGTKEAQGTAPSPDRPTPPGTGQGPATSS